MKKKSSEKSNKKWIQLGLILAVVTFAGLFFARRAMAVLNPNKAMRYSEYAATHTVENSTLFVGTYLITLAGMSDPIYEKAQASAADSGQQNMYYKSELAGGAWFDVTDASGLTDISDAGKKVSDAELADLFVQYVVGADGVVTDVMTGQAINPFDVPDPYKLITLPELEPIRLQYTGSAEAESITEEDYLKMKNSKSAETLRSDVYKYQILTTFFSLNLRDSETDKLDADLARLFASYQALKSAGNDEEADITFTLMGKVDSARRAIIMNKLSQGERSALGILMDMGGGSYYTGKGDFLNANSADENTGELDEWQKTLLNAVEHDFEDDSSYGDSQWWEPLPKQEKSDDDDDDKDKENAGIPFANDSALTDAIANALSSCIQAYNTDIANALTDAETVLGHAEYEYSTQVIEGASADGSSGPIVYLRDVMNIAGNIIKNKDSELQLIDSSLLSLAIGKMEAAVSAGASPDYQTAIDSGEGASAADGILADQEGSTDAARGELEFLITGKKNRTTPAEALSYVQERITATEGMYATVKADAFSSRANGVLDKHMKFLKDLAEEIKNSDASLNNKLDDLKKRKEDAQRKRDAALDDNDLAGAKDMDAQIAAIDQDIADEEAKNGGAADSLADSLGTDALAKIADDPDADISGIINAMADMGDKDGLDKLADRAKDAGASAAQQNAIKDAADKAKDNAGDGSGKGGAGSGADGSGKGGAGGSGAAGKSEQDLLDAILSVLGKSPEDMNAEELAVTATALSRFAKEGCRAASDLAGRMTELARSKHNPYFYQQYNGGPVPEYVSLKTIGSVTGYRYFYDDTTRIATLTDRSKVFTFRTGSAQLDRGGTGEKLKTEVVYSGVPYASESDTITLLGCEGEYIVNNTWAVCVKDGMKEKIEDLLTAFRS